MNTILDLPAAAAMGWTLLHSLWEGAVAALALALVLAATRSSRIRYAAACAAMLAIVSAVVVTFIHVLPAPAVRFPVVNTLHEAAAGSDFAAPLADRAEIVSWLAPLWLAGVIFFYLRGISGWFATRRLRLVGVCCPEPLWQTRLEQLGERLRMTHAAVLLESSLAEVPVVIGYLRPVILIPVGLLTGLPTAQVDAILLHELAHIRRHDYLTNMLQVFVEGMLFYHPAIWWISGVIRNERENCCDDVVVSAMGNALTYASALTALEQRREDAGLALAATGGSLVNRIQRLLEQAPKRSAGAMPLIAAAVLTVSVVTVLMAFQATPQPAPKLTVAAYRQWLNQDVVYIITDDEHHAFNRLGTDEEREHFVEQFWARRDPTPGTAENEFKEEHYRRIAYADEHFKADMPGWKTDRGRIYIQYGPPDGMESHAGGAHTHASQEWRYRWIEGVGKNVIIEFVDASGRNEYRMTSDPSRL